ncbi:hypothetical protein HDV06_003935 [Boothiomyces sp. JEL0866]|nr:hypothetical protein HDV06_003935 [Boothiomyces sp. JEL0866]
MNFKLNLWLLNLAVAAPANNVFNIPLIKQAISPPNSGSGGFSVPGALQNGFDYIYLIQLSVGDGQVFNVAVDTGSSDVWVRGDKVDLTDNLITSENLSFQKSYYGLSVSGNVYGSKVQVGGGTVNKMSIGVSTNSAYTGPLQNIDGLLGLGFSGISAISKPDSNFMDQLGANVAGIFLSNLDESNPGELTLGGTDSSKYAGSFSYFPINSQTLWQIDATGMTFSVNGGTAHDACGSFSNTLIDSGAPYIYMDDSPSDSLAAALGASAYNPNPGPFQHGSYAIPCSAMSSGPPLKFTLKGVGFTLKASDYVLYATPDKTSCVLAINRASSFGTDLLDKNAIIIGNVFQRAYYTVYDRGQKRIGFAPAVHQ